MRKEVQGINRALRDSPLKLIADWDGAIVIGMPPKTFSSVVRMQRAVRLRARGSNLTAVALGAGYFDQAHFIGDFQKATGSTPSCAELIPYRRPSTPEHISEVELSKPVPRSSYRQCELNCSSEQ